MHAKISKWGNSLAIRIPKLYVRELGIREGAEVEMDMGDHELTIRPKSNKKYNLERMLAELEDTQIPERILKNGPVGKEIL
jgi:antitoxin MazE